MNRNRLAALALLIFVGACWAAFGGPKPGRETPSESSSVRDASMALSGEELWSNNCLRCHNVRPPTMYNNAQWDVIVHHMRVRSNITGQEQRAIVEFLKSSE